MDRLCRVVMVNEMQFGFMSEKATIYAVYLFIYLCCFFLK